MTVGNVPLILIVLGILVALLVHGMLGVAMILIGVVLLLIPALR